MMRNLFRNVSVPVGNCVFEGLTKQGIERLGDTTDCRGVVAHGEGADKSDTAK